MKNDWLATVEGELNVSSKAALCLVSMLHTVGPFAQHIPYRWPKQNLSVKTLCVALAELKHESGC